eukprot:g6783.t1
MEGDAFAVFVLKVDTLPPEKDEEEATSYYQLRQMATDGFGTDKKIRTSAILRERFTRSCEVAELDKCKKTIQKRVEEQSKTTKTTFDKDLELKHQILPSFKDATEPSKIYEDLWSSRETEDGLGEIANEQFIKDETDLIQPCMHRLLRMKAPDLLKLSDKSENDLEACGGWHFVLQVLKARGAQNAPPPPPNDAQLFGQKLGVLGLLLRICQIEDKAKRKQKYRKCTPKLLAELLELNVSSPLLKQLHQRCYEAMPGDTAMRVLSIRRTLCATIIWALHLTPELWMNVTKSVQDELSAPTKTLKIAFEFIGCKIEDKPENVLKVQLVGAPKFDQSFYEKQLRNPNQSRKRGRTEYSAMNLAEFTSFLEKYAQQELARLPKRWFGEVPQKVLLPFLHEVGFTSLQRSVFETLTASRMTMKSLTLPQIFRFLAVHRSSEGFTTSQLQAARKAFDQVRQGGVGQLGWRSVWRHDG